MKWGAFSGGAAKGLVAGAGAVQGLMNASEIAKTAEQNRQQSATRMIWEKEKHEREKKAYDDLYGVMIGDPAVLRRWWGEMGARLGAPQAPVGPAPTEASSSGLGSAGGLASY